MKMKTLVRKVTFTLILLAVNFSFTLPVNAQGVNELAKIDVFRAIANGQDITKMSRDNNHCFQVYKQGADIMFANNYTKLNSKSYGRITNVSYKRNREKGSVRKAGCIHAHSFISLKRKKGMSETPLN